MTYRNEKLRKFLIEKAKHCKSTKEEMVILHLWYAAFSLDDRIITLYLDRDSYID